MDPQKFSPCELRYTQNSISNRFGARGSKGRLIGQILDELYEGKLKVSDFPPIEVFRYNGCYWSADNRRLWVFKELQNLGKCYSIPVKLIPSKRFNWEKFTTENAGVKVRVRGDPGSRYMREYDRQLKMVRTQAWIRTQTRRINHHYIIVPEDEYDEDDKYDVGDKDDGRRHSSRQQVWSVARLVGKAVQWLLFSLLCLVVLMAIMIAGIENNRR